MARKRKWACTWIMDESTKEQCGAKPVNDKVALCPTHVIIAIAKLQEKLILARND